LIKSSLNLIRLPKHYAVIKQTSFTTMDNIPPDSNGGHNYEHVLLTVY